MYSILVTEEVLKLDKSQLNADTNRNMYSIIVTEDVSKLDKSPKRFSISLLY